MPHIILLIHKMYTQIQKQVCRNLEALVTLLVPWTNFLFLLTSAAEFLEINSAMSKKRRFTDSYPPPKRVKINKNIEIGDSENSGAEFDKLFYREPCVI